MLDKIIIKGLKLDAIIGIYPHEQTQKQPILIDIDLYTDISLAAKTTRISDTVDYDLVVQRVENIVNNGQFKLIESLAVYLAELILQEFPVVKVKCTVFKPQAIDRVETVGISVVRDKP